MADSTEMKVLSAALDRLIPAIDELPGAGEMGLADEITTRCRADDRFWQAHTVVGDRMAQIENFLSIAGASQDEAIRTIEKAVPDDFGLWLDVVYTIYYMQPAVHKHLGWHGQPPQPGGNFMPPWDLSVLDVVKQREPFWRKV